MVEPGLSCSKYRTRTSADLSPVRIEPFSSQIMLRSPSPSNAIPMSARFRLTASERSDRLSGVGSDPLPGNLPSNRAVDLHHVAVQPLAQ